MTNCDAQISSIPFVVWLCVSLLSIHISVQIPHQDGMLPLISTLPLHNLHLLLSESIYRQQHVCSNLLTLTELQGLSGNYTLSHTLLCKKLMMFCFSLSN